MTVQPSCCETKAVIKAGIQDSAKPVPAKPDVMFWGTLGVVTIAYLAYLVFGHVHDNKWGQFSASVYEMMNTMFWGMAIGIVAMGFLTRVPRDFVMAALGTGKGLKGIVRAVVAGTLLDLCSHGVLMIGAKLYERGASAGQVMAFLISSPWNSLSLTFILVAMIGWHWTLAFIVLSMLIGVLTGLLFEKLVEKGVLPPNPAQGMIKSKFKFWPAAVAGLKTVRWTPRFFAETIKIGLVESKMILRWMFLGVIIAAALRILIEPDAFNQYFGPTLMGLGMTLFAATVIEVCSEGSAPIAADIINRAGALGNGFTFLMAGVATDYTEMMVLRQTTRSWKIALFLPLICVPQVLVLGYLLNRF